MEGSGQVARRWEGVFRPALADPSIERGTHFVRAFREAIEALLPRALHGIIFVRIRAGVVESLIVRRNDVEMLDVATFAFRRGRVSTSVIARVFE